MESDKGTLWPFKACAFLGTTDFDSFLGVYLFSCCKGTDCFLKEFKVQVGYSFMWQTISVCNPNACFLLQYTILTEQNQKIFLKNGHKILTGKQQSKQFPWNFWLLPFPLLGGWTLFQQHRLLVSDEGVMIDHKYCRRKEKRGT